MKVQIIDDDGNEVPRPAADSDVGQLIYLLEYARTRGFYLGPSVQIGGVLVQVRDLRQIKQMQSDQDTPEIDPDSDMAILLK